MCRRAPVAGRARPPPRPRPTRRGRRCAVAALPGLDGAAAGGALVGHEDVGFGRLKDYRLFGDGDAVLFRQDQRQREEHARGQCAVGVGDDGAGAKGAADRVDAAVHGGDCALEVAVGKGRAARGHALALADLREHRLGERELDLDLGQIIQPRQHLPVRDARADIVIGQPNDAGEGRGDGAILQPAAGALHLRLRLGQPGGGIFEGGLRDRVGAAERADPVERLALFGEHRLGLGQIGALDAVIEPRQHRARLDRRAGRDRQLHEAAVHLGDDVDGFGRAGGAHGLDGAAQGAGFGARKLDRDGALNILGLCLWGGGEVGLVARVSAIGQHSQHEKDQKLLQDGHRGGAFRPAVDTCGVCRGII